MCYKFYIFWDGPHTHPATKKRQGRRWPPQHKQDKVNGEPQGDPTPKSTKKGQGRRETKGTPKSLLWNIGIIMNMCKVCHKGSRPCSIQVRLVTAVRFTSNWSTSEPYQKPKKSSQTWKPSPVTWLHFCSAWDLLGRLEREEFFNMSTRRPKCRLIQIIPESRTT